MTEDLFGPIEPPPPRTCGQCVHHDLNTGGLGDHGYGLCKAREDYGSRAACYTATETTCRIGKFRQKR